MILTKEVEGKQIAQILNSDYLGLSRIDGNPIIRLGKNSNLEYYKKFLEFEFIQSMEGCNGNGRILLFPPAIKIITYEPLMFLDMRKKKLKRILYEI